MVEELGQEGIMSLSIFILDTNPGFSSVGILSEFCSTPSFPHFILFPAVSNSARFPILLVAFGPLFFTGYTTKWFRILALELQRPKFKCQTCDFWLCDVSQATCTLLDSVFSCVK